MRPALLLLALLCALRAAESATDIRLPGRRLSAEPGLTKEICAQVDRLQVCAERATALEINMEDNSLFSFRALWDAGLMCYDMSFVSTKDNQLVAGTADSFRWRIEELEPTEIPWPSTQYTVRQLREFGASIFKMPTLDQFMRDMRRRLLDLNLAHNAWRDGDIRRPWVFAQLDAGEFKPELVRQLVGIVNRHRAMNMLLLELNSREQAELVRKIGTWTGRSMRAFPANVTGELLDAEDLEPYAAFSVPLQAGEAVLRRLQATGKLVFGRGVQDKAGLLQALALGLPGITTPHPLQLQHLLDLWRLDCGDLGHPVSQPADPAAVAA